MVADVEEQRSVTGQRSTRAARTQGSLHNDHFAPSSRRMDAGRLFRPRVLRRCGDVLPCKDSAVGLAFAGGSRSSDSEDGGLQATRRLGPRVGEAAMSRVDHPAKAGRRERFTSERSAPLRRWLLAAGAVSSLGYVLATDVVAASLWDGYRRTEQMVSELFAVGSPGHGVLASFTWLYTALTAAFGVGVWSSARGNRSLRAAGGLLAAYGLWNIVGLLYPLHLDDDASVPMHIVATNVQLGLMIAAMCFVAAGFHGRMRWYTVASLATSLVMGMVAFAAAPGPNLVLGLGERLSIGAFLLWVVVLAIALWPEPRTE